MSSYKPPFARRLGPSFAGNKPAPRTAKNPANFSKDPYATKATKATKATSEPANVTEALEAIEVDVAEVVEVVETAEVVAAPEETVEIELTEVLSMKNTKAELLSAAEELGLDVNGSLTKAAILDAINEAG